MPMSLSQRRAAYADEYTRRWHDAKLDTDRVSEVDSVVSKILANQERYEAIVAHVHTMPWWFAACLHYRESSLNFTRHMHNGDRLTGRTVQVPAGRPPAPANGKSYTFEESAIDAFTMPGKDFEKIEVWDIVEVSFRGELYNGFGYRSHGGEPTPYLYAGTNQSDETGKFIADGKFSSSAREGQLGLIAIMLGLQAHGVVLFEGQPAQHEVLPEMSEATIRYVQERLRTLGYYEVGKPDGVIGKRTNAGVSAFRSEHGLGLSTVIDDDLLAMLAKAAPRKVSEERATATSSDLKDKVPGVAGAILTKNISGAMTIGGTLLAVVQGIGSNLASAADMLSPIKDALSSVPGWAWAAMVIVAAGAAYYQSRKVEGETVDAYRRGEIS